MRRQAASAWSARSSAAGLWRAGRRERFRFMAAAWLACAPGRPRKQKGRDLLTLRNRHVDASQERFGARPTWACFERRLRSVESSTFRCGQRLKTQIGLSVGLHGFQINAREQRRCGKIRQVGNPDVDCQTTGGQSIGLFSQTQASLISCVAENHLRKAQLGKPSGGAGEARLSRRPNFVGISRALVGVSSSSFGLDHRPQLCDRGVRDCRASSCYLEPTLLALGWRVKFKLM